MKRQPDGPGIQTCAEKVEAAVISGGEGESGGEVTVTGKREVPREELAEDYQCGEGIAVV